MSLEQIIAALTIGPLAFGFLTFLLLRRYFIPIAIVSPMVLLVFLHWKDLVRSYQLYKSVGLIDGKVVGFLTIQYVFIALAVWLGAVLAYVFGAFADKWRP